MSFQALNLQPFTGAQNGVLAVTDASARVAVGSVGDTLLLMNDGSSTVYFALGTSTVTATAGGVATAAATGSFPILGGAILSVLCAPGVTHVAGICDTGLTSVLRVVRGKGQ